MSSASSLAVKIQRNVPLKFGKSGKFILRNSPVDIVQKIWLSLWDTHQFKVVTTLQNIGSEVSKAKKRYYPWFKF